MPVPFSFAPFLLQQIILFRLSEDIMRKLVHFITALLFAITSFLSLPADAPAEVPVSAWQQTANGVSVAILLVDPTGGAKDRKRVDVYIKNTSASTEYFSQRGHDRGVELYYVSDGGKAVPIHAYGDESDKFVLSNLPSLPLGPNQILTRSVNLTPNETGLVRKYPVFCRFYLSAQEVGGYQRVETAPVALGSK